MSTRRRTTSTPVAAPWWRGLRPETPAELGPVCTDLPVSETIEAVGAQPVAWAVEVGDWVARRHLAELSLTGGSGLLDAVRLSSEYFALQMLTMLATGRLPEVTTSLETAELVRELVRRQLPLNEILTRIQIGHSWFGERYMQQCRRLTAPLERATELERLSELMFTLVIHYVAGLGRLHDVEQRRWITSTRARREKIVHALLRGDDLDQRRASSDLRYDLSGRHLGLVTRSCLPGRSAEIAELERAAAAYLTALGARRPLIVPIGDTEVWAWGRPSRAGRVDVDPPSGVRITVGIAAEGPDGFRRTHLEAAQAAEVTESCPGLANAGVVSFDEVSLLALLLKDPAQAADFARAELGSLAQTDSFTSVLRETLVAFLASGHSAQAAARTLHVARNTVIYRVHRAEELLGRTTRKRTIELWVALLLAQQITTLG
jgi:hypothetical protein